MKKLIKLQVKSEKLLENNELITFRGGYGGDENCGMTPCNSDNDCKTLPGRCTYCKPHPWRPEYWCIS